MQVTYNRLFNLPQMFPNYGLAPKKWQGCWIVAENQHLLFGLVFDLEHEGTIRQLVQARLVNGHRDLVGQRLRLPARLLVRMDPPLRHAGDYGSETAPSQRVCGAREAAPYSR